MAKKIINRRELREEYDAAEREEEELDEEDGDEDGDDSEKPAKGKKSSKSKAKAAKGEKGEKAVKPKRKSRAKVEKKTRLKAYWGVLNQSLKKVAQFEYHERNQAAKKAEDLSTSQKSPHFIRLIKEEI